MYRIIDDRGTGKTGRLMLIAKETGASFVCANPRAMEQKAHAYGIDGINFVSFYDFVNPNNWRGKDTKEKTPVVIDEVESLIRDLNPTTSVIGYSVSKDEI